MKRRDSAAGILLIEMIIFLAVVCFLGEIIVPHFVDETTKARFIALNAVESAINSSVCLSIKKYRVQHSSKGSTIELQGKQIQVVPGTGYPQGSEEGIGAVVKIKDGFAPTYSAVTQYDLQPAVPNCHVRYDSNTGQVQLVATGC